MKNTSLKFGHLFLSINLQKPVLFIAFILAFFIGISNNLDAQRHGGGFRSPAWHYSRVPARGAFYRGVPRGASPIFWGGHNYYFHGGIFYHPYRGGFIIAPPPYGLRLAILPRGFYTFYFGGLPYYYYCGTYYVQREGQYEVVAPPIGAVVESLPQGYQQVEIDGQTYYTIDGVQYKPIMKNGEIWYQVIKSPNKAPEPEQPNNSN